jgi:hypothetical protein
MYIDSTSRCGWLFAESSVTYTVYIEVLWVQHYNFVKLSFNILISIICNPLERLTVLDNAATLTTVPEFVKCISILWHSWKAAQALRSIRFLGWSRAEDNSCWARCPSMSVSCYAPSSHLQCTHNYPPHRRRKLVIRRTELPHPTRPSLVLAVSGSSEARMIPKFSKIQVCS